MGAEQGKLPVEKSIRKGERTPNVAILSKSRNWNRGPEHKSEILSSLLFSGKKPPSKECGSSGENKNRVNRGQARISQRRRRMWGLIMEFRHRMKRGEGGVEVEKNV